METISPKTYLDLFRKKQEKKKKHKFANYFENEEEVCKNFWTEWRLLESQGKVKKNISFHIPNEGKRSRLAGWKLKQMGLVSGVADFVFITAKETFFIEVKLPLKYGKGGKLLKTQSKQSDNQLIFEELCKKNGIDYFLCRSVEEIIDVLKKKGLIRK